MSDPEQPRKRGRPETGRTPGHNIRMGKDRWHRFGEATEKAGTDRAGAVNDFAAWYTHEPNAKMPKRPPEDES